MNVNIIDELNFNTLYRILQYKGPLFKTVPNKGVGKFQNVNKGFQATEEID